MKRIIAGTCAAAGLLFGAAGVAGATPTPAGCSKVTGTVVCSTADEPSNGWTTETTQKGSVDSSHPVEATVTNPGGNVPPGRQP